MLDRDDAERKAGSVGVPPPFYEMRIVGEDGRELPPGEIGEIVGRGPITMPGYYNRPEQTAQALRDGWLFTGDLGYVDEDGFLYLVDRKKDMIDSGGIKVYPKDIEEIAAHHPAILEVAVFGIPHDKWGETPVRGRRAARKGRAGADELKEWINARVAAKYQRLRPRDRHGRISAQRGRQDAEARDARAVLGRAREEDLRRVALRRITDAGAGDERRESARGDGRMPRADGDAYAVRCRPIRNRGRADGGRHADAHGCDRRCRADARARASRSRAARRRLPSTRPPRIVATSAGRRRATASTPPKNGAIAKYAPVRAAPSCRSAMTNSARLSP